MQLTRRLDRIERRLEALGEQAGPEPARIGTQAELAAYAPTADTLRPRLYNSAGKFLVFSSPEAQEAYVEAFADWDKPYIDTRMKSQGMPTGVRSAYLAGLYAARRGEKPVHRVDE